MRTVVVGFLIVLWSIAHRARTAVEARYERGGLVGACALSDEFFCSGRAGARIRRSYCLVRFGTALWLALHDKSRVILASFVSRKRLNDARI